MGVPVQDATQKAQAPRLVPHRPRRHCRGDRHGPRRAALRRVLLRPPRDRACSLLPLPPKRRAAEQGPQGSDARARETARAAPGDHFGPARRVSSARAAVARPLCSQRAAAHVPHQSPVRGGNRPAVGRRGKAPCRGDDAQPVVAARRAQRVLRLDRRAQAGVPPAHDDGRRDDRVLPQPVPSADAPRAAALWAAGVQALAPRPHAQVLVQRRRHDLLARGDRARRAPQRHVQAQGAAPEDSSTHQTPPRGPALQVQRPTPPLCPRPPRLQTQLCDRLGTRDALVRHPNLRAGKARCAARPRRLASARNCRRGLGEEALGDAARRVRPVCARLWVRHKARRPRHSAPVL
eukprot:Amastigsp_a340591_31.p3 type:complete len:349 gc:universal Amastigsp_a340591_31:1190-144(-)